jgi:hypothetical protein
MLQFETENQPSNLRSIIGNATTVGMQKRRPKLALPDKTTFNDMFHLIRGSNHVEVPMKI